MATKIGVYFDESCMGGGLDASALMKAVTKKWSSVAPVVKSFPVLTADTACAAITADIEENTLDGVVLCGSSPRVDWDMFKFPAVQVERVSLREGCVLAYKSPDGNFDPRTSTKAPQLLQDMAQDYVNMGIIKIQKSTVPVPEIESTIDTILVLGGGWTGMHAALNAAAGGHDVVLVEKEAELGGKVCTMHRIFDAYNTTDIIVPDLETLQAKLATNPRIAIHTQAKLEKLAGAPGNFIATITVAGNQRDIPVGAVVLATGWQPQDTATLAPLGYASVPNVVTASEFEQLVKKGECTATRVAFILNTELCDCQCEGACTCLDPVADEAAEAEKKVAEKADSNEACEIPESFVQKDMETARHLEYSKAVSSMVALKQANYVADAGGVAYVIYDHMMVQGMHERFYKAAQDKAGIMMTKGTVKDVTEENGNPLIQLTDTLLGDAIELAVDLIVLPTAMIPTTAKDPVIYLEYRQGPAFPDLELFAGFADSHYICFPYETRRTGIYAAGCVRQPMTLDSAAEDAAGAALKAIQCITSINRGVAVHPRSGDLSYPIFNFLRCTQCKRCTEECPFGALDDDEKGTPKPNPSRCRRCGTCMGACPERVISFDNYNIDQIGSMIREIKVPDDMAAHGPRVLIFACENDAYPALDMAAMAGKPWSPYVRIIPVRCLGSLNAIWVADAMSKGIDGVLLLGCKYGDDYQCHFVKGSEICNRRKENIAESLDRLGIEADRVEQLQIAIDEYGQLPGMIDDFMDMIFEKGPNPFKGY